MNGPPPSPSQHLRALLTLPAPCGTHFIERRKRQQRAVYPHHIGEKEWNSHARTKEKVLPSELQPTGWECKQCFPCLEAPTPPQHSPGQGRGASGRAGGQEEGGREHGLGYSETSLKFQQSFVHDYPLRAIQDS